MLPQAVPSEGPYLIALSSAAVQLQQVSLEVGHAIAAAHGDLEDLVAADEGRKPAHMPMSSDEGSPRRPGLPLSSLARCAHPLSLQQDQMQG